MKYSVVTSVMMLILSAALLIAVPANAAFDDNRSMTLTIGGFTINDGDGIIARQSEYRDLDNNGLSLNLDVFSAGGNWLRFWGSIENPGHQDAAGTLYIQARDYLTLGAGYEKTPHYTLGTTSGRLRELSSLSLGLFPLHKISIDMDYNFEEKHSSSNTTAESDSIALAFHGGTDHLGANLELLDSSFRGTRSQFDTDGLSLQAVAVAKSRVWAASGYYIQKDVDAGFTALSQPVESTQAGVKGKFRIVESVRLNTSYITSEIDNKNTGNIDMDSDRFRIGTVYRFNADMFSITSARLGLDYSKKTTTKANADVRESEDETLGIYVKGTLVKKINIRIDRKDTVRRASGIQTIDFRNANSLGKRVKNSRIRISGATSPNFRFTAGWNIEDENFTPFTAISLLERRTELRNLSSSYQANERLTLFQDLMNQELSFDELGILSANNTVTIGQTYDSYTLGLTYRIGDRSDGGMSYGRSKARVGGFAEVNEINERNFIVWYELEFGSGYKLHTSIDHNSYSDRLNTGLSGVSDLFELNISKTIEF